MEQNIYLNKKFPLVYWYKLVKDSHKMMEFKYENGAISGFIWHSILDLVFVDWGWCIKFKDTNDLVKRIKTHTRIERDVCEDVPIKDVDKWITNAINGMLESDLICDECFKDGVLTSRSIQWEQMSARKRARTDETYTTEQMFGKYCLLPNNEWKELRGKK